MANLGYEDTPYIGGSRFRVHDNARVQPRIVEPGTAGTPETPGRPPSDAVVLFDGKDLSGWMSNKTGGPAEWKVENGFMEVVPSKGDIRTKQGFGDCQLHLEWAAPSVVKGEGQFRGNSGVFLMGLYEIQVLDNFRNPTYADGTCGALYGQCSPLVNACRKPGEWQTYDIIWVAPHFHGKRLISPARITLIQNGILLHHDQELLGPTRHRTTTWYEPHPETGPLVLQDHGDLVRFRNIWYRPLTPYDAE